MGPNWTLTARKDKKGSKWKAWQLDWPGDLNVLLYKCSTFQNFKEVTHNVNSYDFRVFIVCKTSQFFSKIQWLGTQDIERITSWCTVSYYLLTTQIDVEQIHIYD